MRLVFDRRVHRRRGTREGTTTRHPRCSRHGAARRSVHPLFNSGYQHQPRKCISARGCPRPRASSLDRRSHILLGRCDAILTAPYRAATWALEIEGSEREEQNETEGKGREGACAIIRHHRNRRRRRRRIRRQSSFIFSHGRSDGRGRLRLRRRRRRRRRRSREFLVLAPFLP